jgi:hypothetical protein
VNFRPLLLTVSVDSDRLVNDFIVLEKAIVVSGGVGDDDRQKGPRGTPRLSMAHPKIARLLTLSRNKSKMLVGKGPESEKLPIMTQAELRLRDF